MNIHYYDQHPEEFKIITDALKGKMEKIWGDNLKETNQSLDNHEVYLELFEELQYTLRPSSFAELDDPQELDDSRIAAFVAKTRDYKYGILAKRVGPTPDSSRTWICGRVEPLQDMKADNICWIDAARVVTTGAGQQFNDQLYLTVTTDDGKAYRVSDYRIPGRLMADAHEALFNALATIDGGKF